MRHFRLLRLLPIVLLSSVLAAAESGNRPFVERVRPEDYYAVEKSLNEPFSSTHQLVILRTTAAQPSSILTLHPTAAGDAFTLTVRIASESAPSGWIAIDEEIEAAIALQMVRAVELKLHRQVTLSKFKRHPSKTDSDLWFHQKLSDGRVAAAVITTEDTLNNPPAALFVDDFLGGLMQLVGKSGAERAALLVKLDGMATDIVLMETR